jgi:very-short-patch-repair endonuclease
MTTDIDQQIDHLAQRQFGVFSQGQALAGGATPRMVTYRIRSGRWTRLSRAVLSLAGAPASFERTLMAAILHTDYGVVSHTAAGRLHEFRYVIDVVPEITAQYAKGSVNPFARLHRSVDLGSEDITAVGPLWVTSPARTAADLLSCLGRIRAERQIDDLLLSERISIDDLWAVHVRYARQGRPTTRALREILQDRDDELAPPRHDLERQTLELLRSAGLDDPERQVPVPGWVEHPTRVDFAYPQHLVIIEVDGRRWHGDRAQFELDRRRDNAAQLAGWVVLRFTWRQVTREPEYVLATISAALRRPAA